MEASELYLQLFLKVLGESHFICPPNQKNSHYEAKLEQLTRLQ